MSSSMIVFVALTTEVLIKANGWSWLQMESLTAETLVLQKTLRC